MNYRGGGAGAFDVSLLQGALQGWLVRQRQRRQLKMDFTAAATRLSMLENEDFCASVDAALRPALHMARLVDSTKGARWEREEEEGEDEREDEEEGGGEEGGNDDARSVDSSADGDDNDPPSSPRVEINALSMERTITLLVREAKTATQDVSELEHMMRHTKAAMRQYVTSKLFDALIRHPPVVQPAFGGIDGSTGEEIGDDGDQVADDDDRLGAVARKAWASFCLQDPLNPLDPLDPLAPLEPLDLQHDHELWEQWRVAEWCDPSRRGQVEYDEEKEEEGEGGDEEERGMKESDGGDGGSSSGPAVISASLEEVRMVVAAVVANGDVEIEASRMFRCSDRAAILAMKKDDARRAWENVEAAVVVLMGAAADIAEDMDTAGDNESGAETTAGALNDDDEGGRRGSESSGEDGEVGGGGRNRRASVRFGVADDYSFIQIVARGAVAHAMGMAARNVFGEEGEYWVTASGNVRGSLERTRASLDELKGVRQSLLDATQTVNSRADMYEEAVEADVRDDMAYRSFTLVKLEARVFAAERRCEEEEFAQWQRKKAAKEEQAVTERKITKKASNRRYCTAEGEEKQKRRANARTTCAMFRQWRDAHCGEHRFLDRAIVAISGGAKRSMAEEEEDETEEEVPLMLQDKHARAKEQARAAKLVVEMQGCASGYERFHAGKDQRDASNHSFVASTHVVSSL